MKARRRQNSMGIAAAVVAIVALGGAFGCGGDRGPSQSQGQTQSPATTPVLVKAASVQVTYYYLPG
jgi:hypothetical protein